MNKMTKVNKMNKMKKVKKQKMQKRPVTTYKADPQQIMYTPTRQQIEMKQNCVKSVNRRKKDLLSDSSNSEDDSDMDQIIYCFKHSQKKAKYYVAKTTP